MNLEKENYTFDEFCNEAANMAGNIQFTSIFNIAVNAHALDNTAQHPYYNGNAINCIESMIDDYEGSIEDDFFKGNSLIDAALKFVEYAKEELKKEI